MTYHEARSEHFRKFHQDLKDTGSILADYASYNETDHGTLYTSFLHRTKEEGYFYYTRYITND